MAFVTVYHPELDAEARIGSRALPGYVAKGWQPVNSSPDIAGDSADDNPVPVGDDTTPNLEDETS